MSDQQIYIATMKEQISSGMYDELFEKAEGDTFLDIGANIGLVSIHAVPYFQRIVAVEPSPETFPRLLKNVENYRVIRPICCALSSENRNVDFYLNDINFTASSTVNTYGLKTQVSGMTLISILKYCNLGNVDVAKIDAEGAEGEALSLDQLDQAKGIINTYFIETHNCPKTTWEHKLGTLVGNLARCGYHKMRIDGMALTASKP